MYSLWEKLETREKASLVGVYAASLALVWTLGYGWGRSSSAIIRLSCHFGLGLMSSPSRAPLQKVRCSATANISHLNRNCIGQDYTARGLLGVPMCGGWCVGWRRSRDDRQSIALLPLHFRPCVGYTLRREPVAQR